MSVEALSALYDPLQYESGVPYRLLAQLREHHAVVWVPEDALPHWPAGPGFWLVLRHHEVQQVLRTPNVYSSWQRATQLRDPATHCDLAYVRRMMLNMDPPDHTRLRRLLMNSFTSRAIAALEARIAKHAQGIVQRVFGQHARAQGQCDFACDVAAELPLLTLADLLGMPEQDRYLLFDWANRVIGFQDPEYASSDAFEPSRGSEMAREALALRPQPDADGRMPDPRTRAGIPDLYHYAHLLGASKRLAPTDDVMSQLMGQVDKDGGRVSLEEFENLFWLFAVAGNETLRNGIPGGMIALLERPELWEQLRADPARLPAAVDEMLRWWTPVMIFRRTARVDVQLGEAQIRAGDKVVVSFAAANRDPRVFTEPDRFDIDRAPNPHLALGYGPHFCLGAQLARVQMRALFQAVLHRVASIRPAGPPVLLRSNFQRGVKRLPVYWLSA